MNIPSILKSAAVVLAVLAVVGVVGVVGVLNSPILKEYQLNRLTARLMEQ